FDRDGMLDAGFATVDSAAVPFLDRRRPMRMMTSIVACAFTNIVAGSANAADLRLKAPPPPPAAYSWTGVYAGLNVGGGIGVNSNLQNASFSSTALGANGLLTDSV